MSLRTAALVTVDGVDFGNDGLVFDTIDGWYGGPSERAGFVDRPNAHGSFDAAVYRAARVVTLAGYGYADTRSAVVAALYRITGVLAEGELGDLTVTDPDYGTLTARVRLTDGPLVDWSVSRTAWAWQLSLTAPDPRKYAAAVVTMTGLPAAGGDGLDFTLFDGTGKLEFGAVGFSGQLTVANPGTADTYPVFTVTGPVLGGVDIADVATGRHITYAGDIPVSGVLVIDPGTGHAYLNGALRDTYLTTKQWWPVPAGGSSTVQFATAGAAGQAGTLTASIRPAYW